MDELKIKIESLDAKISLRVLPLLKDISRRIRYLYAVLVLGNLASCIIILAVILWIGVINETD